jgi:predicted dehydrogenase
MTERVRIGVVGIGYGQQVHVPAFRADPRCRIAALCASTRDRAAAVARRLEVPHAYGSVREMLEGGEIDAVSIAVPPVAQPGIVVACAQSGKHVFCEKPVAMDEPAAARALAAVEEAHVAHAVDFIFPEIAAWKNAKSILEKGTLGKLRQAALSWRLETYSFAARRDSWKMRSPDGGGTLNSFVSHTFYYLEWLLGPVARLAARLAPREAAGDARVDAWLEMESGCPVNVAVAADAFLGSGHRLEIYGDSGTLVLDNSTADYVNGFMLSAGTRESPALSAQRAEPFPFADGRIGATGAIARRFIDSILSGTPARPNLIDGLRVQRLIAAARTADRSGSWQSVSS